MRPGRPAEGHVEVRLWLRSGRLERLQRADHGELAHRGDPSKGGSGADGQIRITYVSSQTLLAAIARPRAPARPATPTRPGTPEMSGPFTRPGTPVVAETWQNLAVPSGWPGCVRVRMLPESNMAFLDMSITHPALASKQNITISSGWPAAYRPTTPRTLALQETDNPAVAAPQPPVSACRAAP